jgi:hypothetical protein
VKSLFLAVLGLMISAPAFAQQAPTFAAYKTKVESRKNVNVDLASHPRARMFRTNLRTAAKQGVNFGGHYILTGWGCGTNCMQLVIVNARNGRVYFPRELEGVGFGFCDLARGPVTPDAPVESDVMSGTYFKPDSRLLVIQGYKGGELNRSNAKCGTYYFEWTGTRLRQVHFVAGKRTLTP